MKRSICASGNGYVPSGLDRILCGHDEERIGNDVRRVADRHLVLLHHLEQRRLHLRRCAVDLVREQFRTRGRGGVERAGVRPVDPRAHEVGWHEVGRNWMRLKDPPRTLAAVLMVSVLARPGTPSISRWPPASRQVKHPLQHLVLPAITRPISKRALLQHLLGLLGLDCGRLLGLLGHASSFRGRSPSVKHVLPESRVKTGVNRTSRLRPVSSLVTPELEAQAIAWRRHLHAASGAELRRSTKRRRSSSSCSAAWKASSSSGRRDEPRRHVAHWAAGEDARAARRHRRASIQEETGPSSPPRTPASCTRAATTATRRCCSRR